MKRNFLHPLPSDHKFSLKNYTRQTSGVTPDGVRLQHFNTTKSFIHPDYAQGIIAEVPQSNGTFEEIAVFGSHEEISSLVNTLKTRPDRVFSSIRPTGPSPSGGFYLNSVAPPDVRIPISEEDAHDLQVAQRMFPNQENGSHPSTMAQDEKLALREAQPLAGTPDTPESLL